MAKMSMKVKQQKPQKYKTREYNRCKICGRPHAYIRKKHVKAAPNREGGIMASEFPIHSSIVNLVCPKCGKTTKIGYVIENDKKFRVCKKCGAKIN